MADYPQNAEISQLDRKHEAWRRYFDTWNTLEALMESGEYLRQKWSQQLVIKRPKELYDVYAERMRTFTYMDLLQNCIRWYKAKLFSAEAKIDGKTNDQRFATFLENCDRGGTTFATFTAELFKSQMIFGGCYVMVDKPKPDPDIPVATRADEKAQGLDQPYLVTYDPRQAINWETDSYGNLNWIIFKTFAQQQDGPLGKIKRSINWLILDRQSYARYRYEIPESASEASLPKYFGENSESQYGDANATAKLIDDGPHVLSAKQRVPVRPCLLPTDLWFANASYLMLSSHVNLYNGYEWKLLMSCFPFLTIFTEKELTGVTLSETAYLQLGAGDKVEWLEPKGESLRETREHLESVRMEIYRCWHLQAHAKTSTATADGASGYSKEQDMMPATDMLNSFGDQVRRNQQNILLDVKDAAGLSADDEDSRPDVNGYQFDPQPAMREIAQAQAAIDLGVVDKSPTLENVLDTKVAMPLLDGENEAVKQKVIGELKNAPTRKQAKDAQMQDQQDAFEQKFQRSVASNVLKDEADSVAA